MRFAKLMVIFGLASGAAMSGAAAKDWKAVRFGMDATYAPFESVAANGDIVGFEVDYGKALCAKMKVTCTFQNQDWDGVIPALMASKFDVIFSSMNITEERKKKVIFSDMYYATPPVMVRPGQQQEQRHLPGRPQGQDDRHAILDGLRQLLGEVLQGFGDQALSDAG